MRAFYTRDSTAIIMTDTPIANAATKVTIEFKSHNKVTRVPPGMTIFNAASWIGLPIDSTCGALGTCGKCKVRLLQGYNSITAADRKAFSEDELADGWRLSCRAEVQQDIICEVPDYMSNTTSGLMGCESYVQLIPNGRTVELRL